MEFNKWYNFYFENHGKCPLCEKQLVMHCGCVNWECSLCQKSVREEGEWFALRAEKNYIRRRKQHQQLMDYYERREKRKNLDKHEKKHYIEADNQGVQE